MKGVTSGELDIRRGFYQSVKYTALMETCAKTEQKKIPFEVILVLGGALPVSLLAERDTLGIEYRAGVSAPPSFKF